MIDKIRTNSSKYQSCFMHLLITASSFLSFSLAAFDSLAKDWERLPDGRVVIEIYGEKVALTTSKGDLDNTLFYISDENAKKLIPLPEWTPEKAAWGFSRPSSEPTLGDVIEHPDAARAAFDVAKDSSDGIRIKVGPPELNAQLVQGKFDPKTLGDSAGTSGTIYTIQIKPAPVTHDQAYPCNFISEKRSYGFGLEFTDETRGSKTYCLPASQRGFKTTYPLRLECIGYGDLAPACSGYYVNKAQTVSASYAFSMKKHNDKGPGFSKDKWKELDKRMHEFFSYILLNKRGGELQ